jgi:tetratricopeptide (TPR) repeat protein
MNGSDIVSSKVRDDIKNTIESLRIEGNKYFSENKYLEAYENFTKAIDIINNNEYYSDNNNNNIDKIDNKIISIIYSNRSLSLLNLNKFEEALEDSEKSIINNPDWFKGYIRKSQCLSKLNRVEEAKEFLKISNEKNSNNNTTSNENNNIDNDNNSYIKNNKNILKAIKFEEKNLTEEEINEKEINKQVDYLMAQFIKPNEEDAFRNLAEYHKLDSDFFDKNEAQKWINFGLKFGCGDSEDLMRILEDYISAKNLNLQKFHIKELKKYSGLDFIQ